MTVELVSARPSPHPRAATEEVMAVSPKKMMYPCNLLTTQVMTVKTTEQAILMLTVMT